MFDGAYTYNRDQRVFPCPLTVYSKLISDRVQENDLGQNAPYVCSCHFDKDQTTRWPSILIFISSFEKSILRLLFSFLCQDNFFEPKKLLKSLSSFFLNSNGFAHVKCPVSPPDVVN